MSREPEGKVLADKGYISRELFDRLNSQMGLEHTRHRSPINTFVHILSCLAACMPGKAKVRMSGGQ